MSSLKTPQLLKKKYPILLFIQELQIKGKTALISTITINNKGKNVVEVLKLTITMIMMKMVTKNNNIKINKTSNIK